MFNLLFLYYDRNSHIYQKCIRFITNIKMRDLRSVFSINVVYKFECACLSQKNYRSLLFQKIRQPGYKISIVFISIFECIKNHICVRVEQTTVAEIYYIMISYYTFSLLNDSIEWHWRYVKVFPIWIYKLFFHSYVWIRNCKMMYRLPTIELYLILNRTREIHWF